MDVVLVRRTEQQAVYIRELERTLSKTSRDEFQDGVFVHDIALILNSIRPTNISNSLSGSCAQNIMHLSKS